MSVPLLNRVELTIPSVLSPSEDPVWGDVLELPRVHSLPVTSALSTAFARLPVPAECRGHQPPSRGSWLFDRRGFETTHPEFRRSQLRPDSEPSPHTRARDTPAITGRAESTRPGESACRKRPALAPFEGPEYASESPARSRSLPVTRDDEAASDQRSITVGGQSSARWPLLLGMHRQERAVFQSRRLSHTARLCSGTRQTQVICFRGPHMSSNFCRAEKPPQCEQALRFAQSAQSSKSINMNVSCHVWSCAPVQRHSSSDEVTSLCDCFDSSSLAVCLP